MSPRGITGQYRHCVVCSKPTPKTNTTGYCAACRRTHHVEIPCANPDCDRVRVVCLEYALRQEGQIPRECVHCANTRAAQTKRDTAAAKRNLKSAMALQTTIKINKCTLRPSDKFRRLSRPGPTAVRCFHYDVCLRGMWHDIHGYPSCLDAVCAAWPLARGWAASGKPDMPTEEQLRYRLAWRIDQQGSISSAGMILEA